MPIAVFKSIREVSNEDSVHVAANLLLQQLDKKWKTKTTGEKSAYVILEMERPEFITGIDIGNEHSAFVEVQVGNACGFSDILITCSFMTPLESKNSTNTNRVRCFGKDALVESNLDTKWQLVKVICTQPFNKHVQFGLSFINVHVAESTAKNDYNAICNVAATDKLMTITGSIEARKAEGKSALGFGKFALREVSPDSDTDSAAGLFCRWRMSRNSTKDEAKSTAAIIREKSSPAALRLECNKSDVLKQNLITLKANIRHESENMEQPQGIDRNRDELIYGSFDTQTKNEQLERKIKADVEHRQKMIDIERKDKLNYKTKQIKEPQTSVLDTSKKPKNSSDIKSVDVSLPYIKRMSSPNCTHAKKIKSSSGCRFRPFNKLLDGVVIVISGIQNPVRADLRSKALAMGAKYKGDWGSDCTHLICAFKNTPKYDQVKNKGKIVTRSWIEKCYAMKKFLPWRRFALDSEEVDKPESDEEIFDETQKPAVNEFKEYIVNSQNTKSDVDQPINMYDLDASDEEILHIEDNNCLSGSDTDDEIERAIKNTQTKELLKEIQKNMDNTKKIYDESTFDELTEEEEFLKHKSTKTRST